MKVKVKSMATGYLKPNENGENRENSNDPPPRGYRYVTSRQLTGGKTSSPSQLYQRLKLLQSVCIEFI